MSMDIKHIDKISIQTVSSVKSFFFRPQGQDKFIPGDVIKIIQKFLDNPYLSATRNNKNLIRALKYKDDKGHILDCTDYVMKNYKIWLNDLLTNYPRFAYFEDTEFDGKDFVARIENIKIILEVKGERHYEIKIENKEVFINRLVDKNLKIYKDDETVDEKCIIDSSYFENRDLGLVGMDVPNIQNYLDHLITDEPSFCSLTKDETYKILCDLLGSKTPFTLKIYINAAYPGIYNSFNFKRFDRDINSNLDKQFFISNPKRLNINVVGLVYTDVGDDENNRYYHWDPKVKNKK